MPSKTPIGGAMAFYHDKGFVASYRLAAQYAGKKGHVGTMPDVITARLATPPYHKLNEVDSRRPTAWDQYLTTMSAEYYGYSKRGNKILIIAHGIGPMATEQGVLAAYRWEFDDKDRNRRGGRITSAEFHKLESGQYGPVSIVDYMQYTLGREYPFMSMLKVSEARKDLVLQARLGSECSRYIELHKELAERYYREEHNRFIEDPYIITVDDAANCNYTFRPIEDGYAFAHLLSIGQIVTAHHQSEYRVPSWSCDVSCHEWWNGTRCIGVREGGIKTLQSGPDAYRLLRTKWRGLMEPSGLTAPPPDGFYVLMQMPDKTWFTQIDKAGDGMDTCEPEYMVTTCEKIGEPTQFSTDVRHYHAFFKYGKREVQAVLPREANAYVLLGDPENVWEGGNPVRQVCLAQGYRITIDYTRRIMRESKLASNYERMMQLHTAA